MSPEHEGTQRHPMTGNEMSASAEGGLERHQYDVIVIGAGGSGLRAAIAAHESGARVAVLCKSLLEAAKDFSSAALSDDVAIMVVRRS